MIYIDGFVVPIKADATKEAYIAFAEKAARIFKDHGATRVVEGWGDDVPDGKITDFRRSVAAKEGEAIVFSWIEWPDKATRDTGMKKVREDPRMEPDLIDMPMEGKRMIFGGFQVVVDV